MKAIERTVTVDAEHAGTRLDQYLAARFSNLSRARAQTLIHSGNVRVDNCDTKPSHKVRAGESVKVCMEAPKPPSFEAENIPLDIIFEDDHVMVVNKVAGMVVHPAAGVHSGTLVNALLAHSSRLPKLGGIERPGIVHRLDKNTSGLLVVAKSESAHRALSESIARREVKRQYRALVYGNFAETSGSIDAPIGRCPSDRKKMAITGIGSREAQTDFTLRESFLGASHLTVRLLTGRTHQIRVHLSYIGHPVIGDSVYGMRLKRFHEKMSSSIVDAISGLHGHMLHAELLEFEHPDSGEPMRFEAPLPAEFSGFLGLLREQV